MKTLDHHRKLGVFGMVKILKNTLDHLKLWNKTYNSGTYKELRQQYNNSNNRNSNNNNNN